MLELRGVHSGYGRLPVIRNASLQANYGEVTLITGENGAGKSTLLRTIAGFIKPTEGQVLLDGQDISGKNPGDIVRDSLRLVLDGHRVFPELSVLDNIRLGQVRGGAAELKEMLDEIYAVFPILKIKSRDEAQSLSGGQQQMLVLAQAFVAQPKVLLCDEPFVGLARSLIPDVMRFLRSWADQGVAVVIVEQIHDLVLPYANKQILMARGELVSQRQLTPTMSVDAARAHA